jgi:T5SS/PEP-CTERM-associated repeat protein
LTEPLSLGGGATVNAGTLGVAANGSINGDVYVSSGSLAFASPNTFTTGNAYIGTQASQTGMAELFTGSTWASTGYVKVGSGQQAIGTLTIEENAHLTAAGTLYIAHADASNGTVSVIGPTATLSASSLVIADGGTYNGVKATGTLAIQNGGTVTISGPAEINEGGKITFDSGGVFSAGSVYVQGGSLEVAAGQTLAFNLGGGSGTLTFASDGSYVWQVRDQVESPDTEASLIAVTGALAVDATPSTPFHLKLATVCSGGQPGTLDNFSATAPTSWTILTTTGGITGFDATKFTIDTTGFLNPTDSGLFSLAQNGNNLVLNFTPVPEPSTWALLITGLATLTASALRRRKRS